MTIDVECLRRPEHDDGEEIGTRNERDNKRQSEDAWLLLEARREHGEFRALHLPDSKGDKECDTQE